MSSKIGRLLLGTLLTTATVGATLGAGGNAAFAANTVTASVRTNGDALNLRSSPTPHATVIGHAANGARITIACRTAGTSVSGAVRTSDQWDRLAGGGYVSHAYVVTSATIATCGQPTTLSTYPATAKTEGGPLNVRSSPSAQGSVAGTVANGGRITVTCAAPGSYVNGTVRSTSQWDRLTNGNYVSHAYVVLSASPPTCAGVVAGPVGTQTNAQFIAASVAPAQRGYREFKVPASVTIAQAILESGWGRSTLTANDRNYFGIKCFDSSPGPIADGCHTYSTTECARTCYATEASFRTYGSILNSFRDHGRFLTTNSRYRPAFAYTTDADSFLYQIWKAGYATSPTYVANVSNLMRQYDLYRYDR
ncbi:MAG: hypothetical protein QOI74_2771 [Micromonosporaceae bacterium]|nr:hypothetical protein [Micromonosporaceae bacterium]